MPDFTPTSLDDARREPGYIGWDAQGAIFAAPDEFRAGLLAAAADGPAWWPRADNRVQRAPEDGGSILDGFGERGLWHTTETDGWPGYGSGYFPHLTVAVVGGKFLARQHIPFHRAGRALRNEAGGVQTNRITRCQVEIVGRADVVDERGLDPAMEEGLGELAEWLRANWGVPKTCTVTFKPYPASFGKGNGVRLSPGAWERYAGWCGHQHCPENDHGDPGALDWRPILEGADMPLNDDDKLWLRQLVEDGCRRAVHAIMTGGTGQWATPTRDGWEWYTPEVQASATRHLLAELQEPLLAELQEPPA